MCYVTGVKLPVHISCNPSVGNVEGQVALNITAAATPVNSERTKSVNELVQLYHQTSVESDKSRYRYFILMEFSHILEKSELYGMIPQLANLLTETTLRDIKLTGAEVASSIILYCEVSTVEALSYLQQMIDSGELSDIFSSMLSLLAEAEIIATASLPSQEYDTAFTFLNSADGKHHILIF